MRASAEIADERHRLKMIMAEFSEQERSYEDQRQRHIAEQQRVKQEERKAAVEAQQHELYVPLSVSLCSNILMFYIMLKWRNEMQASG